eukprot:scaffold23151_cov117-Isochrysis_galbana.AAC.11
MAFGCTSACARRGSRPSRRSLRWVGMRRTTWHAFRRRGCIAGPPTRPSSSTSSRARAPCGTSAPRSGPAGKASPSRRAAAARARYGSRREAGYRRRSAMKFSPRRRGKPSASWTRLPSFSFVVVSLFLVISPAEFLLPHGHLLAVPRPGSPARFGSVPVVHVCAPVPVRLDRPGLALQGVPQVTAEENMLARGIVAANQRSRSALCRSECLLRSYALLCRTHRLTIHRASPGCRSPPARPSAPHWPVAPRTARALAPPRAPPRPRAPAQAARLGLGAPRPLHRRWRAPPPPRPPPAARRPSTPAGGALTPVAFVPGSAGASRPLLPSAATSASRHLSASCVQMTSALRRYASRSAPAAAMASCRCPSAAAAAAAVSSSRRSLVPASLESTAPASTRPTSPTRSCACHRSRPASAPRALCCASARDSCAASKASAACSCRASAPDAVTARAASSRARAAASAAQSRKDIGRSRVSGCGGGAKRHKRPAQLSADVRLKLCGGGGGGGRGTTAACQQGAPNPATSNLPRVKP